MDEREYEARADGSTNRRGSRGPVGTVLGWTFGPFGAAVGSVVDENRFAFKLSIGAGGDRGRTDDRDRGTTIEIDDAADVDVESDDRS